MTTTPQGVMEKMRAMWGAVDYHPIAVRDVYVSELLVRSADVHSGAKVLDVGAGSGNTTLAAARRGAAATATDLVPATLETASLRAAAEGLAIEATSADAQDLPFGDDHFDVVLSTFGAMYAPDHQRAADELVRVCRPGGRLGMANWTPGGLVGRLQAVVAAKRTGPPPGGPGGRPAPPTLWGTEQHCAELFGDRAAGIVATTRIHHMCAASVEAQFDMLVDHLPPWHVAYRGLEPEVREEVKLAAIAEFDRANIATDGTCVAEAEYLEVVVTLR